MQVIPLRSAMSVPWEHSVCNPAHSADLLCVLSLLRFPPDHRWKNQKYHGNNHDFALYFNIAIVAVKTCVTGKTCFNLDIKVAASATSECFSLLRVLKHWQFPSPVLHYSYFTTGVAKSSTLESIWSYIVFWELQHCRELNHSQDSLLQWSRPIMLLSFCCKCTLCLLYTSRCV